MSKLLEDAVEQVKKLTDAEQDRAAEAMLDFAAQRAVELTDEQLEELHRRRSNKGEPTITVEEARRRLRDIGA
jgi:hypothetical protein